MSIDYGAMIEEAQNLGAEDGHAAASWVFDGNTSDDTYRAVLAGMYEGDPAVTDLLPAPDLSGQWAGTRSFPVLLEDVGYVDDGRFLDSVQDEIATAYEDAFTDAVWHDVSETAQRQLA